MKKGIQKLKELNVKILCVDNSSNLEDNAAKIVDYIINNWRKK